MNTWITGAIATRRPRQAGSARTPVLVVCCFLLGAAVSAFFFHNRNGAETKRSTESARLAESTRAVLQNLENPVEVRFYSFLEKGSVPEATVAFGGRVDQLLAAYGQEAGDKLKITRFTSSADASAAAADGIRIFNQDKGEGCFLGLSLRLNNRKELLAQLSPEFEPALESDLTRALARLVEASHPPPVSAVPSTAPVNEIATKEVRLLLTNLATISLEDGTRALREAAMKEFQATTLEMEAKVKAAEQQLVEAKNSQSEADQKAALQRLQQAQNEQVQKLKEIAARSLAQIEALQRMKASSH